MKCFSYLTTLVGLSFLTYVPRLKVDKSGETLVIPVDVEVGPVCGLYSPDDLIDFGIGGTQDLPKEVKIYLKNSWKKPIRVQVGSNLKILFFKVFFVHFSCVSVGFS